MKSKTASRVRTIVQIIFFALIALIAINHSIDESGGGIPLISSASTHALCPFGGVVSIYEYFDTGRMVKKVHDSSFILMWIGFGLALLFGPVFCGWVCPFGTFQEWIGKIGKKIFKKRYNTFIPAKLDNVLRYARYLLLALVLWKTAVTAQLMFANIDPYYALFNMWAGEVALGAIIILGIVTVLSLFVERPFCKYACPYGAVLGVFNLFRIFRIKRKASTCIDCRACDIACPMNIEVSAKKTVRDHQCITCMKCTSESACPIADTVELAVGSIESKEVSA